MHALTAAQAHRKTHKHPHARTPAHSCANAHAAPSYITHKEKGRGGGGVGVLHFIFFFFVFVFFFFPFHLFDDVLCLGQSRGVEHLGQVSVSAVDPEHQGQGDGHKRPGDALRAGGQRAAALLLLQLLGRLQVVARGKLEQLIQQDDG